MPTGVYIRTVETKMILSKAHKGLRTNLGKKWKINPEKLKLRKLRRGNHTGCKHSEEVKKRISTTKKAAVTLASREHCRKIGLKGRLTQFARKGFTKIELIVKEHLTNSKITAIPQHVVDDRWFCDYYLPSYNLILECDGEYWHSLEKVVRKDRVKNSYLLEKGYNLLRLKESDIKSGNYISLLSEKIKQLSAFIGDQHKKG